AFRDAMYRAIAAKEYAECLGPVDSANEAAYQQFCTLSLQNLEDLAVGDYVPPTDCGTPQALAAIPGAWIDLYSAHRDSIAAGIADVYQQQQALLEELPASRLPFLDRHESFTAFHIEFEYPVGPVSVIVEIELGGSW